MANKNGGFRGGLLNTLAFWAILLLGFTVIVGAIVTGINSLGIIKISGVNSFIDIIKKVAFAITIIVTLVASYNGSKARSKGWFYVWVAAAIIVILGYILSVINF